MRQNEIIVDLFAGGGGASLGIELALGRPVDVAINHDELAVAMHAANHQRTLHYCKSVYVVSPLDAVAGRPVGLLWASPDCTDHSRAKGGPLTSERSRDLAWVVVDWAAWVRPWVICLENVIEFRDWSPLIPRCDSDGNPMLDAKTGEPVLVRDPERKGTIFREFVAQLQNLGYRVEWQVLNAADFGAPTTRKRLFLVARRDGLPIEWPEPTHGAGRPRPWRPAAECIDWALPCPSIFRRKRHLVEKTLQRLARGVGRYVLDDPAPFLVQVNHGRDEFRGQALTQPMPTITGRHGFGLVTPFVARTDMHQSHSKCTWSPAEPLTTIMTSNGHAIVAPLLTKYHGPKGDESRAHSVEEPLRTLDTSNRFGLCYAFLSKHYTGVVGQALEQPLGTVTAIDHHSLGVVHISKQYGGGNGSQSLGIPLPTVTSGGPGGWRHLGMVVAFLQRYNGTGTGQNPDEPLGTLTTKDRFALTVLQVGDDMVGAVRVGRFLLRYLPDALSKLSWVRVGRRWRPIATTWIDGWLHLLVDIGMRMLEPRELARAQGFPDSYVLTGSKAAQVARIGNSVCPPVARALVEAQFAEAAGAAGAA